MQKQESIKFLKVRDVISPSRAFPTDAGIDFYVPKFTKGFVHDLKNKNESLFKDNEYVNLYSTPGCIGQNTNSFVITDNNSKANVSYNLADNNKTHFKYDETEGKLYFNLSPHSRVLIPSGIYVRMESPRSLIAANKSGVASKKGLIFGSQVVDYEYKGEIHISIINTSTEIVRIYEDMKIIQFIETPIYINKIEVFEGNDKDDVCFATFYDGMHSERDALGFGSTDKK